MNENSESCDVTHLINRLNAQAHREVAFVVDDPHYPFTLAASVVPRDRHGIRWNAAVFSSGPCPGQEEELEQQSVLRIISDFDNAIAKTGLSASTLMYLGSDDYFPAGILCEASVVPDVLAQWLPLPHGIEIVDEQASLCVIVTLARSVFVFSRNWSEAAPSRS